MAIQLTKDSIDLGIVVRDAEKSLAFYRDVLGFEHAGTMPMPGGSTMERLMCGTSMIKLVSHKTTPEAANPAGGIPAASGFRYFTISVADLEGITAACEGAGAKIVWPVMVLRPGIHISMVEDPDGNWVEFLEVKPAN
jgi:catechol 2,3-dioxygenase-like lactoylglutathione lyase family enzyme